MRDALVLVPRGTMDEVKVQVVPRESSERTAVTRPGEQQRVAFWFSLAVEVPVALAFCARSRRTALATAGAALVATGLTHPVAWWAITFLTPRLGWAGATALVELTLTAFEVLPYRLVVRVSWRRALVTSLVANAASFVLGQL